MTHMSKPAACVVLWLCTFATAADAQLNFRGLVAGESTRRDVERVFGKAAASHSETLVEYRPTADARNIQSKIYVQYRLHSTVVERIEVMLVQPFLRSSVIETLVLPADTRPSLARVNRRGVLEEYYGAPLYVVLTFAGSDPNSGVTRSARYSRDLFTRVMAEIEKGAE